MSIADHFDHAPDTGFVRDYTSDNARRQFKVSLVLLVVIAMAATALGLLISFDGPRTSADPRIPAVTSGLTEQPPAYAGKL